MNASKIKSTVLSVVVTLAFGKSYSQLSVPFNARYQANVKGDMTIIANNITNRVDYNNSSNVPYYNQTNYAKLNDELSMKYIDIDEDENTFSSSSAELILNSFSERKVVYAGLYWSATYKYNSGYKKDDDKFVADDSKRDPFDQIKIKFPNQDSYTDIKGQVIFDGLKSNKHKENAPYTVYADVTSFVKNLENPSGIYTVANVKATQGMLVGGVAAGWTMLVVYEDPSMSEKHITTYDGFASVESDPVNLDFNGFQTLAQGKVRARVAFAALEGDNNLSGDQFGLKAGNSEAYSIINTPIRKNSNFLNSSITIENQNFANRFPDSNNTLGFDSCLFTVPNTNNMLIGNNVNDASIQLKSMGDNYYLFFAAMSVEVSSPQNESESVASNTIIKNKNSKSLIKEIPAGKDMIADLSATNLVTTKSSIMLTERQRKVAEIQAAKAKNSGEPAPILINTLNMSNQEGGYYIVANVFSVHENATNFIKSLKEKGIEADYFDNKINNYRYVYIKKTKSQIDAIETFMSKAENKYDDKLWILSVNKNNSNDGLAIED